MITKKLWNSFKEITRIEIIETYYGDKFNCLPSRYQELKSPYNHDFDFNLAGKKLKEILSTCYLQKDGTINVIVSINPVYEPKPVSKPIKKVSSTPTEPCVYYVDYEDKSGDLCHVWTNAYNAEEAKQKIMEEYWDVNEIISVSKK